MNSLEDQVRQSILLILRTLPGDLNEKAIQHLSGAPFDDAGLMISLLFARMLEITLERLNGVPKKNLFAFLDAMGVSLLLPSAATVPLTFAVTGRLPSPVPK